MSVNPTRSPIMPVMPIESVPKIKYLVNMLLAPWKIDETAITFEEIKERLQGLEDCKLLPIYNTLFFEVDPGFFDKAPAEKIEIAAQEIDRLIDEYFATTLLGRMRPIQSAFLDEIMGTQAMATFEDSNSVEAVEESSSSYPQSRTPELPSFNELQAYFNSNMRLLESSSPVARADAVGSYGSFGVTDVPSGLSAILGSPNPNLSRNRMPEPESDFPSFVAPGEERVYDNADTAEADTTEDAQSDKNARLDENVSNPSQLVSPLVSPFRPVRLTRQETVTRNELLLMEQIQSLLNLLEDDDPPQAFDTSLLENIYRIPRQQFIDIWEEAETDYAIAYSLDQGVKSLKDYRKTRFEQVVNEALEKFKKSTADSSDVHLAETQPLDDDAPFPSGVINGYFPKRDTSMPNRQEQINCLVSKGFDREVLENLPLELLEETFRANTSNTSYQRPHVVPDSKGASNESSKGDLRADVEIILGFLNQDDLDPEFVTDGLFGKTGITKEIFLGIWETARKMKGDGDERSLYNIRFDLLNHELNMANKRLRAEKERMLMGQPD